MAEESKNGPSLWAGIWVAAHLRRESLGDRLPSQASVSPLVVWPQIPLTVSLPEDGMKCQVVNPKAARHGARLVIGTQGRV